MCLGPTDHSIPFSCLNESIFARMDLSLGSSMALTFICLVLINVFTVLVPILTVLYLIFIEDCFIIYGSKRKPTRISIQLIKSRLEEGKLLLFFKEFDIGRKMSCCPAWTVAILITFLLNLPLLILACALISFIGWWIMPFIAFIWVFYFFGRIWSNVLN